MTISLHVIQGTEQLLGNMNTLNRKLEESIAVGQEFEPISNLWGQFVDMMSSSGLTPQAAAAEATSAAGKAHHDSEGQAASSDPAASSSSGDNHPLGRSTSPNGDPDDETLPPGVAPGGGIVYGRD